MKVNFKLIGVGFLISGLLVWLESLFMLFEIDSFFQYLSIYNSSVGVQVFLLFPIIWALLILFQTESICYDLLVSAFNWYFGFALGVWIFYWSKFLLLP